MLTPIGKRLIVKPVESSHGSIIVTNSKPTRFTVIQIGDEVTKVNIDDIIYLDKHYGVEIHHEQDKFVVIDEACILAKVS